LDNTNVKFASVFRYAACAALVIALAACSGDKDKDKIPPEEPVDVLYNRASDLMDQNHYTEAAKAFAEVERQHPYSQWATRAQLMEAYADYQALAYDDAVTAVNAFIDLHPGSSQIAYAYYLKALCNYERIADVRRDQSYARNALKEMQDVVSRFPDTIYAKDATLKIALIYDHLAGAEMSVGRWYMSQKLYIAAIGRFRTVIEKYQMTSHVPEALERLVECYIALGITKEAKATAAVLGYNFPGSDWYEDAYDLLAEKHLTPEPESDSWIGSAWHSVF
jgi:outer membrane protein assembly factor BamD